MKRSLWHIGLLVAAMGAISVVSYAQVMHKQVHLSGEVRNAKGDAVAGATVRAQGVQTVSDGSGHYDLELRLTLSKVTNSAELAKIDADTGLQENVGPSINRKRPV